jgi:purine-binding chemotaxis protein CheW
VKTPEQYFQDNVGLPDESPAGPAAPAPGGLSPTERQFLDKYLGMTGDVAGDLRNLGLDTPVVPEVVAGPSVPAVPPAPVARSVAEAGAPRPSAPVPTAQAEPPAPAREEPEELDFDARLKDLAEIQLISFRLGSGEFALPVGVIQEVIRYLQPVKLPAAPPFMAGIVNLRGRITPLVWPRALMGTSTGAEAEAGRFIVVCRHRDMQVGLVVDAVATMYRAPAKDIEWGIEAALGIASEYLVGLLKAGERLVSIISIDRLIDRILKS